MMLKKQRRRGRKVHAVRRHSGSLCVMRQPGRCCTSLNCSSRCQRCLNVFSDDLYAQCRHEKKRYSALMQPEGAAVSAKRMQTKSSLMYAALCRHEKKRQKSEPVEPPRRKTDQEKVKQAHCPVDINRISPDGQTHLRHLAWRDRTWATHT